MAILSLQNFNTMAQNFASTVQGTCKYLVDFSTGSILLSVAEASSAVGLWMQWLILIVLNQTRLATSYGADADSWVNDLKFTRLPGTFATGSLTLSRFATASQAAIVPGAQFKTADGTQSFIVVADATQSIWNPTLGAYIIPSSVASGSVTVQSQTPGIQGNVQAGTITLMASAIPFIDTVTNAANFANGLDAESDAALKVRFSAYIQTLSRGTIAAIGYAVASVQQGLSWSVAENTNTSNTYQPGNFVVTVDDGSGTPSASLLSAVNLAVAGYRPLCATWAVLGPTVTTANISFSFSTSPVGNKPALLTPVRNAVVAYVNAIPDGSPLVFSRVAGVAYSVDPSIVAVESVLINGGTVDIVPALFGAVKATFASVTPS